MSATIECSLCDRTLHSDGYNSPEKMASLNVRARETGWRLLPEGPRRSRCFDVCAACCAEIDSVRTQKWGTR